MIWILPSADVETARMPVDTNSSNMLKNTHNLEVRKADFDQGLVDLIIGLRN